MLKLSSAVKFFNGQPVFSGLNLTVEQGSFHVILGPSGCGKSTLFDGLTGVFPFDEGELVWQGRALSDLSAHAAYMQQKDLLLPWFSLLDNALLPARTSGRDMNKAKAEALELFERLGLKGYESYYSRQVSGGMRQRCALVRTLMFRRDLILLDEPLSALDTITRRGLQSMLLLLQTEFEKTILMITHDVDEALFLADEISVFSPRPMSLLGHYAVKKQETENKIQEHSHVPNSLKPGNEYDPVLTAIKTDLLEKLEPKNGRKYRA
jgi:ABC-type nitrate/sulfonate/bicarbonate transport system ATPase subunit